MTSCDVPIEAPNLNPPPTDSRPGQNPMSSVIIEPMQPWVRPCLLRCTTCPRRGAHPLRQTVTR